MLYPPVSLDEQKREFRRRFLKGSMIVVGTCVFWLLVYTLLCFCTCRPKVMATSHNKNPYHGGTITVLAGPRDSFWISPIAAVLENKLQYRFEYNVPGSPQLWSCQSSTEGSNKPQTAQIEWVADDIAITFLEQSPRFVCKEGIWSKASSDDVNLLRGQSKSR